MLTLLFNFLQLNIALNTQTISETILSQWTLETWLIPFQQCQLTRPKCFIQGKQNYSHEHRESRFGTRRVLGSQHGPQKLLVALPVISGDNCSAGGRGRCQVARVDFSASSAETRPVCFLWTQLGSHPTEGYVINLELIFQNSKDLKMMHGFQLD